MTDEKNYERENEIARKKTWENFICDMYSEYEYETLLKIEK